MPRCTAKCLQLLLVLNGFLNNFLNLRINFGNSKNMESDTPILTGHLSVISQNGFSINKLSKKVTNKPFLIQAKFCNIHILLLSLIFRKDRISNIACSSSLPEKESSAWRSARTRTTRKMPELSLWRIASKLPKRQLQRISSASSLKLARLYLILPLKKT